MLRFHINKHFAFIIYDNFKSPRQLDIEQSKIYIGVMACHEACWHIPELNNLYCADILYGEPACRNSSGETSRPFETSFKIMIIGTP